MSVYTTRFSFGFLAGALADLRVLGLKNAAWASRARYLAACCAAVRVFVTCCAAVRVFVARGSVVVARGGGDSGLRRSRRRERGDIRGDDGSLESRRRA